MEVRLVTRFLTTKNYYHERLTLFDSSHTSDRLAFGCIRLQCRWLDPYINRIGRNLPDTGYHQEGLTGMFRGKDLHRRSEGRSFDRLFFYQSPPHERAKIRFAAAYSFDTYHTSHLLRDPV